MRIVLVNRYYSPDHSGTSQVLTGLSSDLAARGHEVEVVTSRQLYDNPKANLPRAEVVDGVKVFRASTTQLGRARIARRAVDYFSFLLSGTLLLLRKTRRGDVLVCMTDPPMLCVIGAAVARIKGARLVNWSQDVYPEIAVQFGVPGLKGALGKTLTYLRNVALRTAKLNVTIGDSMARHLRANGAREGSVRVVANWSDVEDVLQSAPTAAQGEGAKALRAEWGLEGKFVVGYSGNFGRAHDKATILETIERLKHAREICFLFVGNGQGMREVQVESEARGYTNVVFKPYQPRESLAASMSLPDVSWVSMRANMEGLLFPSKLYSIAASGRPIVAIAPAGGDVEELVRRRDCGIAVAPAEAIKLADAIVALSHDRARCAEMGRNARVMLDRNFTKAHAMESWSALIAELAPQARKVPTEPVRVPVMAPVWNRRFRHPAGAAKPRHTLARPAEAAIHSATGAAE